MSETTSTTAHPSDPNFAPSDLTQDELAEAIHLLFGENGSRAMAAALGPHHPSGARDLDSTYIRKWLAGSRTAPLWAKTAIGRMLIADARRKNEAADRALGLAQRLLGEEG